MEKYIGTKIVSAEPQTIKFIDGVEHAEEHGYKVVYKDGYESWSPKEVFEEAYRSIDAMNFGLALEAAKMGHRIARHGWNGKGQYVFLADEVEFHTNAEISEFVGSADIVYVADMLVLRTAQGNMQPGWLASQADMLAEDWYIVDDEVQ